MHYGGEKTSTREWHPNQALDNDRHYPCPVTVTRFASVSLRLRLIVATCAFFHSHNRNTPIRYYPTPRPIF